MSIVKKWEKNASALLLNRTIVKVRYMSSEEVEDLGWDSKAIVLHLDDGTIIYPSRDDEGNDAGALFTTNDDLPIIPVI
jgi:hypothetical protein